jgi:hypothetical protein
MKLGVKGYAKIPHLQYKYLSANFNQNCSLKSSESPIVIKFTGKFDEVFLDFVLHTS